MFAADSILVAKYFQTMPLVHSQFQKTVRLQESRRKELKQKKPCFRVQVLMPNFYYIACSHLVSQKILILPFYRDVNVRAIWAAYDRSFG